MILNQLTENNTAMQYLESLFCQAYSTDQKVVTEK